ncbi:G1 family glutamic endopeptidase [Embleya sp. NPDC059237]|uniref:G1 family glutamic endopeptidase n=1 Tax=Embleya sp. NPDC059237 TaxID=3346784 RepID=UPI0036A88D51
MIPRARTPFRSYGGCVALLLCAPLIGAAPAAAAASSAADTPAGARSVAGGTSGNWSGYAASGSTYHSVSASWVQPSITCAHTGAVSIWVGLDGRGSKTVEQTGTQAECNRVGGTPRYFAWWENYPDPESVFRDPVRPGDTMTASVVYNPGSDNYTTKLTNSTLGWTETKTLARYRGATNGSAEVIAEAPSRNGARTPLADFGSVTFTNATIDGRTLAAASAGPVTMVQNGVTDATPGPLSASGDAFTDTWKHY